MKKMNKKGFTLIELLAIIVILAIIAVITVPLILNIIEDARSKAAKNSVLGYGKAVELAYSRAGLGDEVESCTVTAGNGSCIEIGEETYSIDYSGDNVVCTGENTITDGKLYLEHCTVGEDEDTNYYYDNGQAAIEEESGTR